MTFPIPTLRTTALVITRSVVASAFLVVAATSACTSDVVGGDNGTVTPTVPTSVSVSFREEEVTVSASPTFTAPGGAVKPVTWKLTLSGTHDYKPAAGQRQNRLLLSVNFDGDLATYFLYTVFDITSVPASLPPTHTTGGITTSSTPPPGGILMTFSGTAFSTTGPATEYESTDATGATSLESYTVTGTTDADVKLTASMKFDKLTLQTIAGDFVIDGTLSFSGANAGGGGTADAGGGGGGCIVGAWKAPTSCGKQIILNLPASGQDGSLTNPDCNGICSPIIFPFDYTSTATSVALAYKTPKPITCSGSPMSIGQPKNDTFTYVCSGNTLTTTTSRGSMTYEK